MKLKKYSLRSENTDNLAKIIETGNYTPDQIEKLLKLAVENNKEIYGAAISFESDYTGPAAKYSTISVYQKNNKILTDKIGKDNTDNHIKDWYLIPKELNKPLWSEPYFDEGGQQYCYVHLFSPYLPDNGNKKNLSVLFVQYFSRLAAADRFFNKGV